MSSIWRPVYCVRREKVALFRDKMRYEDDNVCKMKVFSLEENFLSEWEYFALYIFHFRSVFIEKQGNPTGYNFNFTTTTIISNTTNITIAIFITIINTTHLCTVEWKFVPAFLHRTAPRRAVSVGRFVYCTVHHKIFCVIFDVVALLNRIVCFNDYYCKLNFLLLFFSFCFWIDLRVFHKKKERKGGRRIGTQHNLRLKDVF